MKKGLCVILSVLLVAVSFSACSKKDGGKIDDKTKIAADGSVYVETKDEDGNIVTSIVSDDKSEKSDEKTSENDEASLPAGLELNSSVVDKITEPANGGDSDLDMFAKKEDLYKEGTTLKKKTTLFEKKVQKVLKTGRFTIDMSITSGGKKTPTKLAFDKDKMYASFVVNGMQAGIIYKDKTAYILFPNLFNKKVYMEYPDAEEMMGEMFSSFDSISGNQGEYVGSSKVKVGKNTYTCEEYKSKEGATSKFYFDGNDWKRYECITDDGSMVYEINAFSGKVDDKLFSLDGYTKMDEKALAGLSGGLTK